MHAMIISQQQDDGTHRSVLVLRRGGHTAVTAGAMLFPGEPGAMAAAIRTVCMNLIAMGI